MDESLDYATVCRYVGQHFLETRHRSEQLSRRADEAVRRADEATRALEQLMVEKATLERRLRGGGLMDLAQRELLIARICSGFVRCSVQHDGRPTSLLIKRPTREQQYIAQELYAESLRDAELQGLFSDGELYDYLIANGLWDEQRETLLRALPKEIDEFKVALLKAVFKSHERTAIRKALATAKGKLAELVEQRGAYTHLTCSGVASVARTRYLLGCSLYRGSTPVFDDDFWDQPSDVLDAVMQFYSRSRLEESVYRELARTEPWRSIWSSRAVEGQLFGVSPVDFTEEQRGLVCWSALYDNVYQHPECPADEVLEDDDLFDGWLITQRRQREQRVASQSGESLVSNEKIRNAQEQFLVAETPEDAGRIMGLNDEHARHIQRQRFAHLRKQGQVNELEMPDTRQRLRMEATQKLAQGLGH